MRSLGILILALSLGSVGCDGCSFSVFPKQDAAPAAAAAVQTSAVVPEVRACDPLPIVKAKPCPYGTGLVACFDFDADLARKQRITILRDGALGRCRYVDPALDS